MRRQFLLQTLLACILLLGIAAYSGRLVRLYDTWSVGQADIAQLSAETQTYLRSMREPLDITYFATRAERMPSHLKETERQVRRLLEALKDAAPDKIEVRVIDPDASGVAGIAYAARRKASSFSVRRVLHDEQSEQKIWSSLVLKPAGRPDVLIQSIQNEHLPHLEGLIIEHIRAQQKPPRPVFAVAANGPYRLLPSLLNEHGSVIELNLDQSSDIPLEADVLFWIQPGVVTPEHIRSLQRFVQSGRSVVLAGSAYAIGYAVDDERTQFQAYRFDSAWGDLLYPFGIRPVPDLLLDTNSGSVNLDVGGQIREVEAPFHLRMLPAFYNMKGFRLPARGGINLVAPSALEIDLERVAESGLVAEQLGTTTENVRVLPLPAGPFDDAALQRGIGVPKQNLLVRLSPQNAWHGEILVLASAAPFQDGIINQPGYAHRVFTNNLARTYGDPARLVRARVDKNPPPRLVLPSDGERLVWRLLTVFLIPAVALGIGAHRYQIWQRFALQRYVNAQRLRWPAIALIVLIAGSWLWSGSRQLYLDFTEEKLNTPAATTLHLLQKNAKRVQATLYISARAALPTELKGVERRVVDLLEQGDVPIAVQRPDALSAAEIDRLAREGIGPFFVERVQHDTLSTQAVWSALHLRAGERDIRIKRLDERALTHLEFLLSAGLYQLENGRRPRVAVISDLPRLSPAEALEDYHKKGLIPPSGADVYSQLKELLSNNLYDVQHINPKDPILPPESDVLLWLQPRRDSTPVIDLLSGHLQQGKNAIVALQHFNIQQRQYRGNGFQTVYWPQPQFQDFDRFSRLYGVEQVREVLFDRTQSHLDLETQVNRTAVREYDAQQVALPFLIRAVAPNYRRQSALTRHLGDLLFIWGNRFALNSERLAEIGMDAQVLVSTSERSWAYAWSGGWLPPDVFSSSNYLQGTQPLAVQLTGLFNRARFSEDAEGRSQIELGEKALGTSQLLLVGSSEMFKNEYLYAAGFQHDQFLLNAVAHMAYGEALAELQARRPVSRGFAFQNPQDKSVWRAVSIGLAPLLFALYGAVRLRRLRGGS
ncbi:MAG: Gldg family protein [Candidatus Latescibacterota bacterium]|nr:Gldg family protein [Candidatus Latescibacterota bacterium]